MPRKTSDSKPLRLKEHLTQMKLGDFIGENTKVESPEEREKRLRRIMVRNHMKDSILRLLQSTSKNSVELRRMVLYFVGVVFRLEREGAYFIKITHNNKNRLFKKKYCLLTTEDWKKCPLKFCEAWMTKDLSLCPVKQETKNTEAREP